uniref:ditrans,polycis-polyprenyl diphosphate synthase [(2E,6E)-farnesyldiphosphate specific] n=1 Tax=Glossina palpalis gambiensis TaxID=67801 RepID=A0A1B0BDS6_9MUSC
MLIRIYQFLWNFLNVIMTCYKLLVWLRLRLIAFALWSYDLCQTPSTKQHKDFVFLRACRSQLSKIPKHLNLIVGPEDQQVNEEVLTRIFSYALIMGIDCISFYDTRQCITRIKNQPLTLKKIKCPKGVKSETLDKYKAVWQTEAPKLNGYENYAINGSKGAFCKDQLHNGSAAQHNTLKIYEIQPGDGRPLLAQICRDLYQQRHTSKIQNLLKERNLLADHIGKILKHRLNDLSEPDLTIIFSDYMCTYGMLPWHTRFTEFYQLETGCRIDTQTFAHILCKYSRCEQRWGK